jgi:hypothetical protein
MSVSQHRMIAVMVLIVLSASVALAEESFPPQNPMTLVGQYTDTFPLTFRIGAFRLPLKQNRRYAIQYRKTNSNQYVFLCEVVQADKSRRDIVVAVLQLPAARRQSEIIEFAYCRLEKSKKANDDLIFGIIDQSEARSTYVPERAWRVDLAQLRFEELPGPTVRCKPESLAGPGDLPESETSSW